MTIDSSRSRLPPHDGGLAGGSWAGKRSFYTFYVATAFSPTMSNPSQDHSGRLLPSIGCAGWSVPGATADAFPAEGSHLERYAAIFPAVEVNTSFYRNHLPATWARWRDSTPEAFRFSVKIPRTMTHERRLKQSEDLLDPFIAEVSQLKEKLGCLLVQLPPSLRFDPAVAGTFFQALRDRVAATPVACEPRHATWFTPEAAEMLRALQIGCVYADPSPVEGARPVGHEGLAYVRLHGSPVMYISSYPPSYLADLARRLQQFVTAGRNTWCIFDNTQEFAAVPNALALMNLLEGDRQLLLHAPAASDPSNR